MSSLSIQNISSSAASRMDTLQVPPRRLRNFRIPSTPEQLLRKEIRITGVRLECQMISFIQLVQSSMKKANLPTKKLWELCTRLSTTLKTEHISKIRLARFELKPNLAKLLKETFADLSNFLVEYLRQQNGAGTISFEQLEDVGFDVDELRDTLEDFLIKTPPQLKHGRSEDGEPPRKKARSEEPLKIVLTAPTGETRVLAEWQPIVPNEMEASLLLSINGST